MKITAVVVQAFQKGDVTFVPFQVIDMLQHRDMDFNEEIILGTLCPPDVFFMGHLRKVQQKIDAISYEDITETPETLERLKKVNRLTIQMNDARLALDATTYHVTVQEIISLLDGLRREEPCKQG